MQTRLKLDFWLPFLSLLFSVAPSAYAIQEDLPDPEAGQISLVEIDYPPEPSLHYRERRADWGAMYGVRYDDFYPSGFTSSIDKSKYQDIFGAKSIPMVGIEGGAKLNMDVASAAAQVSYSVGSVSNTVDNEQSSLNLTRIGLHLALLIDTLWAEPYVVPYAQADVYQFSFQESLDDSGKSGESPISFGYTAGLLFQLNWLDPHQSRISLIETGLDNTFISLFISQTIGSDEVGSFASDMGYGAGLKVEF